MEWILLLDPDQISVRPSFHSFDDPSSSIDRSTSQWRYEKRETRRGKEEGPKRKE
jgi:hypothetical protein